VNLLFEPHQSLVVCITSIRWRLPACDQLLRTTGEKCLGARVSLDLQVRGFQHHLERIAYGRGGVYDKAHDVPKKLQEVHILVKVNELEVVKSDMASFLTSNDIAEGLWEISRREKGSAQRPQEC
jgi:hypothetical protein